MKLRHLLILATVFAVVPALSFGQETIIASGNSKKEKSLSYSIINEYGFSVGGVGAYPFLEGTGVLVNGIRFNKTREEVGIGIGVNFFYFSSSERAYPIFLNYRYYFSSKTKLKPLINVAIGTQLRFFDYEGERQTRELGFYGTIATGFKVEAISFTPGLFIKSRRGDLHSGIEIKAGFTF